MQIFYKKVTYGGFSPMALKASQYTAACRDERSCEKIMPPRCIYGDGMILIR